jgi:hypothetical protein
MKKAFRILGIVALVAIVGLSMAACSDDSGGGGGNTPGGGGGLEGDGVVWELLTTAGKGTGTGIVFKDGKGYQTNKIGSTWDAKSVMWTSYTRTELINRSGFTVPYTLSGNTLVENNMYTYARRTGQKITWS